MEDGNRENELRSFGRRRGRKLSPRQQGLMRNLLPRLAIDLDRPAPSDLRDLFSPTVGSVALEVGFGGAEHFLWQAERNPKVGYIGCEPFEDGLAKALIGIEERGLSNVRLHPDDVRDVLRWLPPASLDRAFILFPDPWPKARHRKRRLIQESTLRLLARAMKPGATLRVATDIADYARTMFIAFAAVGVFMWSAKRSQDWRHRPADWPATRYEDKAKREGRRCYYLTFTRMPDDCEAGS